MEKIKMTCEQFKQYLNEVKGCQFINVMALTDADMYLKGNPLRGRVKKFTITPMQFGYDYENAVNNRLERDGKERSFRADKLPFGSWVDGMENKVITHNDMFYMRTYCVRNAKPRSYYFVDGHIASAQETAEIFKWLKPSSTSEKQSAEGLSDEFQVKPRSYKFSSLVAISIKSKRIYIEG